MWSVETLNHIVDDEILALPPDMIARLDRYVTIIEDYGLQELPRDAVKNLEGKLWELCIKGKDGISRAIYVTAHQKRVVILRVFIKKSQKTPKSELEIARLRMREVK
jgi:phage-related protein